MEVSRFSTTLIALGLLACAEPTENTDTQSDSDDIGGIPTPSNELGDTGLMDTDGSGGNDTGDILPVEAQDYDFMET